MAARNVDFEGITSLDYGFTHWYDHWWVILRLRGSVWPSSLLTVALSLAAATLYHYFVFDRSANSEGIITNPTIFAFYMQTAGIVLAFMTSICYGRYWEGLSALCQMGQSLTNLASLAISFERENDLVIEGLNGTQWKAQLIHTVSLLHATCIACLKCEDRIVGRPLDVFGGMTALEQAELSSVEDKPALVLYWLQDLLASRLSGGGLAIKNPPVVAQVWTCMVTFVNALAASKRIAQFPLPLPLHHCLAFSDIFVAFLAPFVIAAFVPNLVASLLIVFATSLVYHGLFVINVVALQQPFGAKSCHLPLAMLHRQVIKGMLSLVTQEIAVELITFFDEDEGTPSNENREKMPFAPTPGKPPSDFAFPPVDTNYITEAVDKRKRKEPARVVTQISILSQVEPCNSKKTSTVTPGLLTLNHCSTSGFSPIPTDVAPLNSIKHPALLKKMGSGSQPMTAQDETPLLFGDQKDSGSISAYRRPTSKTYTPVKGYENNV